ncbi:EamA family transporter (plasmid) [Halarchaeum sp. CBA1220]|uniref:EamA family transporter n=1 Tax=Halarchaeum sp. CBA1220 TaxID=1853682 RepID=UPI000F3A817A|nr:EamA family transporter [Halarchaeum sp. CBA1220]QLC35386.1 EamA family transporter [Halarchaeum sp. CBA1220]
MTLSKANSALFYGTITMVAWGLWMVFGDAASDAIDPRSAAAISYLVAAPLALAYVVASDAPLAVPTHGGALAAVSGLFAAVGLVAMYVGLASGPTAVVSTLGAMYFVVAAALGVAVSGDDVSATTLAGIAFAVVGVALIAR